MGAHSYSLNYLYVLKSVDIFCIIVLNIDFIEAHYTVYTFSRYVPYKFFELLQLWQTELVLQNGGSLDMEAA